MSSDFRTRRLPAIVAFTVGLMLTMIPLPESIQPFRPSWVAMLVIFWAMRQPRTWSVGSAWLVGIVLDVSQGTLLGQHALALAVIAFITVRAHLLMRVFPIPQLTATVFALLTVYQFLLFWINGVAGVEAGLVNYWGPILVSTVLWPIMILLVSSMRLRAPSG